MSRNFYEDVHDVAARVDVSNLENDINDGAFGGGGFTNPEEEAEFQELLEQEKREHEAAVAEVESHNEQERHMAETEAEKARHAHHDDDEDDEDVDDDNDDDDADAPEFVVKINEVINSKKLPAQNKDSSIQKFSMRDLYTMFYTVEALNALEASGRDDLMEFLRRTFRLGDDQLTRAVKLIDIGSREVSAAAKKYDFVFQCYELAMNENASFDDIFEMIAVAESRTEEDKHNDLKVFRALSAQADSRFQGKINDSSSDLVRNAIAFFRENPEVISDIVDSRKVLKLFARVLLRSK